MTAPDLAALLSERPALAVPALCAGGLLIGLTPCIDPMIAITAAIAGGQSLVGRAPRE